MATEGITRLLALIVGATASAGVAIAVGTATARRTRARQHFRVAPGQHAGIPPPRRPTLMPVLAAAAVAATAMPPPPAAAAGGDECTMCKRPITAVTGSRLRCGHAFHDACVAAWPTHFCPVCRRQEMPALTGGAATGSVVSLMDF